MTSLARVEKTEGAWGWDLALALLAVALGLLNFWVHGLFKQGLPPFDETRYFDFGRALWQGHVQAWSWSPLMALVYAPFAYPGADPDLAYHLCRLLLGPLNVLLAYRLGRLAADRPGGVCLALAVAFNHQFLTDYAAHFAGMTVSLLALTAFLRDHGGRAVAILLVGTLVRPELGFAAVAVILLELWKPGTFGARPAQWAWAAVLVAAYILVFPDHSEIPRVSEAFIEHYAWGVSERGLWSGSVWSEYDKVGLRDFGQVYLPISGYLKANPRAFFGHVLHNVWILPKSMIQALAVKLLTDTASYVIAPAALFLAPILFPLLTRRPGPEEQPGALTRALWAAAAVVAGALPVWLLIRPRPSYLHMVTPFVWVLVWLGARRWLAARADR
jgi:hypothetical protein